MVASFARISAGLLMALGLASCASVSVEENEGVAQRTAPVEQKMPVRIYVMGFRTADGDWNVDREGEELSDFKKNLRLMLKTAMVTDLCYRLVAAEPGETPDESRRENAWLVRGEFVTVNQGSRLLRGAVGFGVGGTKVETRVDVYDLADNRGTPFLTFTTTGGSGAEPGAILTYTTDPLEIAVGAVAGVSHGLSEDTKRTAREITSEFSDYMYKHGWIEKDLWIQPKRPGGHDVW